MYPLFHAFSSVKQSIAQSGRHLFFFPLLIVMLQKSLKKNKLDAIVLIRNFSINTYDDMRREKNNDVDVIKPEIVRQIICRTLTTERKEAFG